MEEETEKNVQPDYEEEMKLVMTATDYDLAMGGVAFTVNSMAGVYFDHFSTDPYDCAKEEEL